MKSELLRIIKNLNGNVFTLGIVDKELIKAIQTNKNITKYLMLNIKQQLDFEKSNNYVPVKKFKISKIRKKNKKKKIDYSICEINDCKDNFNTLINDTIYFNKNKVYYYGNKNDYDIEVLIKKYRRYNVKIEIYKFNNGEFILEIDTSKAKTNMIKRTFYRIVDFFELVFDSLTNFLVS